MSATPVPDPGSAAAVARQGAPQRSIRYLSRADVEACSVTMLDVIDAVERAFRAKGLGEVEMPAKTAIHPGSADSFIHAMPASVPTLRVAGMKWVSGYPENQTAGLPYISGLLILNDAETGIPSAVMDATWITAVRTAAASAVSARRLARPDCERLAILGCGVQGLAHLEALPLVLPRIAEVAAYDPDAARADALLDVARSRGYRVQACTTPEAAVRGSDAVVTAGPILHTPHASIRAGWLAEGAFASAVDFDSYWAAEAFAELDVFTTDDVPQLEHFRAAGYFAAIPPIDADLGDLVVGRHPGRTDQAQRTMACNLGIALEDVAVAPLVLVAAERLGLGTVLPL